MSKAVPNYTTHRYLLIQSVCS